MKRYCGRDFTDAEIETIRQQIAQSPTLTRADLSRLTCRQLGWFKPDGGLKEMSCRVAMLRMQDDGVMQLPAPRATNLKTPFDGAEPGHRPATRTATTSPRVARVAVSARRVA